MEFKKLSDLYGHDLAGWQITHCYFLELDHDLMGIFPALDREGKIVATLEKKELRKVWNRLDPRPAKVTGITVVANSIDGVAFYLGSPMRGEVGPLKIFSAEEIDTLCETKLGVRWTPGLLQMNFGLFSEPVFD